MLAHVCAASRGTGVAHAAVCHYMINVLVEPEMAARSVCTCMGQMHKQRAHV